MRALLDSWVVSAWLAGVLVLIALWQVRLLLVLDQGEDVGWSASIALVLALLGMSAALANIHRVLRRRDRRSSP